MKKRITLIVTGLLCVLGFLVSAVPAQAAVTTCTGEGVAGDVQYGQCATDKTGGTGSVTFYHGGAFVTLQQAGSGQKAAFWASNGPLAGSPTQVCANFALSFSGRVSGEQDFSVSYNGAVQQVVKLPLSASLTSTCATIPTGATNIWVQLTTVLGGTQPWGKQTLSESFFGFTASY